MTSDCNRKNPLLRSGTHQRGRYLPALKPDYFRVDERSTADLILFAQRYSQHIKFYDNQNQHSGNWLPFFSRDISAVLAGLGSLPVGPFITFNRSLETYLTKHDNRTDQDYAQHFKLLFHLPIMLLQKAGEYFEQLPFGHEIIAYMSNMLARDIQAPLAALVKFYKGAVAPGALIFDTTALKSSDFNTDNDPGNLFIFLPARVSDTFDQSTGESTFALNDSWFKTLKPAGWGDFYTPIPADTTPYQEGGSFYEKIYDALNYNLLSHAVESLYQSIEKIAAEAAGYLKASLTDFHRHPPHYGLWLAFLELFKSNQRHLNTLTGRHLDFYYRDILKFCRRTAEPSAVNLLFELNKTTEERLLQTGTRFKAGKDSQGREAHYALDNDMVVNRGRVASLKSLYRRSLSQAQPPALMCYSADITNSRDGQGEKLPKDDPQWRPFGPAAGPAKAHIGFAVADRMLFLREGIRKITIAITLDETYNGPLLQGAFKASFTTEDGWLDGIYPILSVSENGELFIFTMTLDNDEPAIVPYDPAVHQDGFDLSEPVVKIRFAFEDCPETGMASCPAAVMYAAMQDWRFKKSCLRVEVDNVRNVTLNGNTGIIDSSQPFLPFGPAPEPRAAFILGSSEIFSKKLASLKLNLRWEKIFDSKNFFLVDSPADYKFQLQQLKNGDWKNIPAHSSEQIFTGVKTEDYKFYFSTEVMEMLGIAFDMKEKLADVFGGIDKSVMDAVKETAAAGKIEWEESHFTGKKISIAEETSHIELTALGDMSQSTDQSLENQPYSNESQSGYLRFILSDHFGHQKYIDTKTLILMELARKADWKHPIEPNYNYYFSNQLPKAPYTPRVINFSISYKTPEIVPTMPDEAVPARFLHLYPFGFKVPGGPPGRLFPELLNQGELYIGVQDLHPPQRLSLLFQTVDGSANPLKNENDLTWDYLAGDEWQDIEDQFIDDKTNNLTQSGIIGIAVPAAADIRHHLLPSGLYWFRMAAGADSDAHNNLLSIDAQAATARFVDQDNDPSFLATPLAAGTISKLLVSDGAIKKINQPYAAYGGKQSEGDAHFYTRASERLRHKDRAVTLWDYERIVLENFPQIYRVKCISHTRLHRDSDNNILADNELYPGHVLVVPIPYVRGQSMAESLRPYTDKKTIGAIDRCLRKRISPFVQLEVQNPKIEEIQVRFKVVFTDENENFNFYQDELRKAIIRFLTPWAFDEGAEITFGGVWHKSAIIDFVEEIAYVDYLKDFEMYHKADIMQDDASWNLVDQDRIEATTSRSILVSHKDHTIIDPTQEP